MVILGQAIYPDEVLVFQLALQRLVVLGDPLLMAAFGDHAGAPTYAPHQSDLRRRTVTLLGNGGDDFVLEQLWRLAWRISGIGTGEGRVAGDVDTVLFMPRDPVTLL